MGSSWAIQNEFPHFPGEPAEGRSLMTSPTRSTPDSPYVAVRSAFFSHEPEFMLGVTRGWSGQNSWSRSK